MKRLITVHCIDCDREFQTPQGSRRKYCVDCLVKRVVAGKKQEG